MVPLSSAGESTSGTATAGNAIRDLATSTSLGDVGLLAHHQVDDDDEQNDDDGSSLDAHDQYVPWGAKVVRSSMTRLATTTSDRSSRRIRSATDSLRTSGLLGLFMNRARVA